MQAPVDFESPSIVIGARGFVIDFQITGGAEGEEPPSSGTALPFFRRRRSIAAASR